MHKRKSWDQYYFDVAEQVASRSTCLSQKIGAILVRDKIIICEGYNGAARGIPPCGPDRLTFDKHLDQLINRDAITPIFGSDTTCPRQRLGYPSGQGLHLCPAVHAEANCISNAARIGIKTYDTIIYLTCGVPCKNCLSLIVNAGVKEVVVTTLDFYDELSKFILRSVEGQLLVRTYDEDVKTLSKDLMIMER